MPLRHPKEIRQFSRSTAQEEKPEQNTCISEVSLSRTEARGRDEVTEKGVQSEEERGPGQNLEKLLGEENKPANSM